MKTHITGAFAPVFLLVAAMNATRFIITSLFLSSAGIVRFMRLRARKSSVTTPPEEMSGRKGDGMDASDVPDSPDEILNGVKCGLPGGAAIAVAVSDAGLRRKLCRCISSCYSVRCFPDGLQAWDCLLHEGADLLICDTRLEGMDGGELSSRVKTSMEVFPVPVILLDLLGDDGSSQRRRYSSRTFACPRR